MNPAVLVQLIRLQMAGATHPRWEGLFPPGGEAVARATYFLLHRDVGPAALDTSSFVVQILERLLRQLACSTSRELVEHRGRVRGKVAWSATVKRRMGADHNPTRFVCLEAHRRFDTPENQLLKYVVETIWTCLTTVPAVVRDGACLFPDTGDAAAAPSVKTAERLAEMEAKLPRLRAHARLRAVPMPEVVTGEHLRRAEGSKLEEYGLTALLHRRYRDIVEAPSWDQVARFGRTALALPARDDAEGQPWLRLAAAVLGAANV